MADELIDIYDENLVPQGTNMKSVAHKTGLWHKSIHCWIIRRTGTDSGSVLFQKRGSHKDLFPNALDISAAGHYQSGESVADGVREIVEELGLRVAFEELVPLGIKVDLAKTNDTLNHEFCETFLLHENQPVSAYDIDPEEVEGLVEIHIADGLALFSGEVETARAVGFEVDPKTGSRTDFDNAITKSDFIPRIDPYYYKVFIMADLFLRGSRYLAI